MTTQSIKFDPANDRLANYDFQRHNEEVKEIWAALNEWKAPKRIPIILGTNTRYFMFSRVINPGGLDFRKYSEDPDVMFDAGLRFQRWSKFNLLQDLDLGMPAKWCIAPDFQNYYEAAWFGCDVHYFDDQVPDTLPDFTENPESVMEKGLPDPFGGLMKQVMEYWEHFKARAQHETFLDLPIEIQTPWCGMGTDGPMTVACNLFGPNFVCESMLEEPERLQTLLTFITDATIRRMTAWRKLGGVAVPQDGFGFADDSVAMISKESYREHILPHHRRLCDALGTRKHRSIHLCGDSTRHFLTLRDELNIQCFDTGFPVDFGALRRELGPKVRIQGGPHVSFLMRENAAAVREKVRAILQSGVLEGGLFLLREGNNLAPGTPLANTEALYHAGVEFGSTFAGRVGELVTA